MKRRSRTIRVLKRDSSAEPFDAAKLRRSLWLALGGQPGWLIYADSVAQAIHAYLRVLNMRAVSSRALFEMAVGALRCIGRGEAAERMEEHARWRRRARRAMVLLHDGGQRCEWDRSWVIEQLRRRWRISPPAARALSGHLERQMLQRPRLLSRQDVLDAVDELADHYGLTPWCLLASVPAE